MTTAAAEWLNSAERQSSKIVLVTESESISAGVLAERVRVAIGALSSRWGVRPGDVVALLAPNTAEFVVCYFAVTALGAIVQPVDSRLKPDEMAAVLAHSRAGCALVHASLWETFSIIRDRLPTLTRVASIGTQADGADDSFERWMAEVPPVSDIPSIPDDAIAELMYTSGTSAAPKGVLRTHANVEAATSNAISAFGYRSGDVTAIVMPLSHSSALTSQLLPTLRVGGKVVLLERFDERTLLETLHRRSVACLRAVPTIFRLLLTRPEFSASSLPSLRLLMNSSAPIDKETIQRIRSRFPSIELVDSYGLTEASTCTVLTDELSRRYEGSIGRPIDGVEMCIMDDQELPVEDGEEGEIWVRGRHVFVGYRDDAARTASAFGPNGWLKTGDLGYRDALGLYYFRGRKDDLINCGGHKYAPIDVEDCILELSEVAEAAVMGIEHRVLGEVAKAFVVSRPGASIDKRAVIRHCTKRLPSYKVPFFVEIVDRLPQNSVGKVLHRNLRAASGSTVGASPSLREV